MLESDYILKDSDKKTIYLEDFSKTKEPRKPKRVTERTKKLELLLSKKRKR